MRFLLLLLLALAVARTAAAGALDPAVLEPVPLAPGVYAFFGDSAEVSLDNQGRTGNAAFLVGAEGVIVVDNGASYRHGQAMLAGIARTAGKPVHLAIITHAGQAFVFGSAAFAERGVPLLAHADAVELMRSRCEHCLENLRQQLGEQLMRGTRLVLPERTVRASAAVEAGGRRVDLLHFGWGSAPGNLAVFDRASGVLITGALVTVKRIPDLHDGQLPAWLTALDLLERVPARVVVPAYGPAAGPAAIAELRAYLLALETQAREFYDSGLSLMQALDAADLPAYRDWAMYPVLHRRNLQQRYLELEVEDLERVGCQQSAVSCP